MELSDAIKQIDRNELINQVVLSWFPELKIKIIDSDEDALDKYRVYLRKFSSQKAIDKITKKLIEFEKFDFNIHEFTNKLEGVYYQNSVFYLEIVEELKSSKEFLKISLKKETDFLEKDLRAMPKLKWVGGVGHLAKEFHIIYRKGFIDSSMTDLINWIDEVFNYGGKKSSIEDVMRRGKDRYPQN